MFCNSTTIHSNLTQQMDYFSTMVQQPTEKWSGSAKLRKENWKVTKQTLFQSHSIRGLHPLLYSSTTNQHSLPQPLCPKKELTRQMGHSIYFTSPSTEGLHAINHIRDGPIRQFSQRALLPQCKGQNVSLLVEQTQAKNVRSGVKMSLL